MTNDIIKKIYKILESFCINGDSVALTGSASLERVGLHFQLPKDLDFAVIVGSDLKKESFIDRLIRYSEFNDNLIYKGDSTKGYTGDIGDLVQVYIFGIKVDLFFKVAVTVRLSPYVLENTVPFVHHLETYKAKFNTSPKKALKHLVNLQAMAFSLEGIQEHWANEILRLFKIGGKEQPIKKEMFEGFKKYPSKHDHSNVFFVKCLEAGQRRKYGAGFYDYKIKSFHKESVVKDFCMKELRQAYYKSDKPNPFAGEVLEFGLSKDNDPRAEFKTYRYRVREDSTC